LFIALATAFLTLYLEYISRYSFVGVVVGVNAHITNVRVNEE